MALLLIVDIQSYQPPLQEGKTGRLCSNLENFNKHIASKLNAKNPKPCEVWGLECYTKCNVCNAAVHYLPQKGSQKNQTCFVNFHGDYFFGLARNDATMVGMKNNHGRPHLELPESRTNR
eukprot:4749331-Ditylum_brightwellii.AAC.1